MLGARTYFALIDVRKWVHRRVERIQIVGTRHVRRQVSVDLSLPLRDDGATPRVAIVPVAILLKEEIVDFTMRDEGDRAVPILTHNQNQFVALSLLRAVAHGLLKKAPCDDVVKCLAKLTYGDHDKNWSPRSALAGSRDGEQLSKNKLFLLLCATFERKFLLLAPLSYDAGERRVVKFSYMQSLEGKPKLAGRLGWRASDLHLDIPGIDESDSYHCEIEIPEGLKIVEVPPPPTTSGDAGADAKAPPRAAFGRVWGKHRVVPSDGDGGSVVGGVAADDHPPVASLRPIRSKSTIVGDRVHFLVRDKVERGSDAFVEVWLRPRRMGLLSTALVYSIFVTIAFAVLLVRQDAVEPSSSAAATTLLTLAGFASFFIVRVNEHSLSSRLLVAARTIVWGLSGCLYLSGLLVAVRAEGMQWWSLGFLVVSSVGCLALMVIMTPHAPRDRSEQPAFYVGSAEGNMIDPDVSADDIKAVTVGLMKHVFHARVDGADDRHPSS